MKEVNNYDNAEGSIFASAREMLSEQIDRRRETPSVLFADICLFAVAFLFARCHVIFGARPLAIALLSLLPTRVFIALIGSAVGAISLGPVGVAYAIVYTLAVALRIILSGAVSRDGRAFCEELMLRVCEATVIGFILAVYQLLVTGMSVSSVLFGLSMTLIPPLVCFALSGIFDTGIGFEEFFVGEEGLLRLQDRTEREKYRLIFFHFSALFLSMLLALSMREWSLFGFSVPYIFVTAATIFTAKRFGAVRAGAVGFVSALPLSAMHSVAFGLSGIASGIVLGLGGLLGVVAGALVLTAWSAYTGGGLGVLSTLPEYAVGAALILPFVNKTLQIEKEEKPITASEDAVEMVNTMTTAYKNRPSRSLDSLEEALIGISSAARGFENGCGVREEEYRELVLASARGFSRGGEIARELCIEKASIIAARLKSGAEFSPSMLGLIGDEGAELCELISKRAASLEEERYKQSLLANKYEDYRLISKLLNESRAADESERLADPELCERLSLLFAEFGFEGGIIKAFGERKRHIIAAGDDPDGSLITSPDLRAGIERTLDTHLGEAEYFRRGKTVLMEVSSARKYSLESAYATISGASGEVSGDVTSSFESGDDYFYSLLSDGMGSGELARETADFVSRFMSYALSFGGYRDTVMHLLNHIIRRRGEECSATVDLFELDLITGDALFIKSGAAPSFVKRDSSIFRIRSESAPIGLMSSIDAERMRVEIKGGDYVIMLSDGVSSTPEDAPWLIELLAAEPKRGLKEYAEYILAEAVKNSRTGDDMTVVVVKIDSLV